MVENLTFPPVPKEDNLAQDLMHMMTKVGLTKEQTNELMMGLLPYLVSRDYKILTHGYDAGRASA